MLIHRERVAEHIIELQSMPLFFAWLVSNIKCQIDCDFFLNFFNKNVLSGTTAMPGGYNPGTPSLRIMEALGSWTNDKKFRLLQRRLNGMKAQVRPQYEFSFSRGLSRGYPIFNWYYR